MELLLGGLLSLIWGSSLIFARDFWWKMTKFGNQMEGEASERLDVWEGKTILAGVVLMGIGFGATGFGARTVYLDARVPAICIQPNRSPYSLDIYYEEYIRSGCAAARQGDYIAALTNFKQAASKIPATRKSDRPLLTKAIEEMEKKRG